MQTDFDKYLKRKNVQRKIDKLAKQYKDKKVMLYGAGTFSKILLEKYDFSKVNIIGAADRAFTDNVEGDFFGFIKYSPDDLLENEFDLLLLMVYDDDPIRDSLDVLFEGEDRKFETKTLVQMNIFEYIKHVYQM